MNKKFFERRYYWLLSIKEILLPDNIAIRNSRITNGGAWQLQLKNNWSELGTLTTYFDEDSSMASAKSALTLALMCALSFVVNTNGEASAKQHLKKSKLAVRVVSQSDAEKQSAVTNWVAEFNKAINTADATAVSGHWTESGRYTDEMGNHYAGRLVIEKVLKDVYGAGKPAVDLIVEDTHFPAPAVAVVEGSVRRKNGAVVNHYALTLVQDGGKWLITSATETPIVRKTVKTSFGTLNQLDWLVGDWRAAHGSGNVRMNADWTANKHFILCKFEISDAGKPPRTETQVIGWDPVLQQPISWMFDANGGYSEGAWKRQSRGWSVDNRTVLPDGGTMTAKTVISDLTPNGFKWQSVDRRWNGTLVEDSAPLVIERAKK